MRTLLSLPFIFISWVFWKISCLIAGKIFVIGRQDWERYQEGKPVKLRGFWTNDTDIEDKVRVN